MNGTLYTLCSNLFKDTHKHLLITYANKFLFLTIEYKHPTNNECNISQ